MWVRKGAEQIARERGRFWRSFRGPVVWFLILFFAGLVKGILGPFRPVRQWFGSWSELVSFAAVFAAVVAIVAYGHWTWIDE